MTDKFQPIPIGELAAWVFTELEARQSIFGIPRACFYDPASSRLTAARCHGRTLGTPLGVAAGPHSQMAQNIVSAWLCGARFIELKTVQTLDRLDIPKPCIAVADGGFNREWSQELTLEQSLAEYVHAWVLVHVLQRRLEFPGDSPQTVFDSSVGYDLEGIRRPNMQRFLDAIQAAEAEVAEALQAVLPHAPEARGVDVPPQISNSVTLSTMHGCPPAEIGQIASYLMAERGLHTTIKLNPTLLGVDRVREILSRDPACAGLVVPGEACEHDLQYDDAVSLIRQLREQAAGLGVDFGVKLTNTLPVADPGGVFDSTQEPLYMSGRPLHALAVTVAARLREELGDGLPMSFCGGAQARNVADLVAGGLHPVTLCTDLLRPGGYTRLGRCLDELENAVLPDDARERAGNLQRYAQRVVADLTEQKARKRRKQREGALPLLDCRDNCGVCATVCPNRAMQRFDAAPGTTACASQVAVLTAFCNACGNCASACPEGGRPYREKPRLYLHRAEFDAETDNAFMIGSDPDVRCIFGRFEGTEHRLTLQDEAVYSSPDGEIRIDAAALRSAGESPALARTLYALLEGITASLPHLPASRETER